jgi:hypothetical protein
MADRILYLFPDTNLFIQCLPLQQIYWTLWSDFDEVHLLVSRPVQREIDHQKNRGNDRVGQRARKTYQMFRNIATGEEGYTLIRETGPRVELHLEALSNPSSELGDQLDYGKPDDEIVGCCHRYSHEHAGSDVRLLTHDAGPIMTARSLGVPFEPIPESWILPAENSHMERENARLKEEVNRLKQAEPEFTIRCVDAAGQEVETLECECQVFEPLGQSDLSELLGKLKDLWPICEDFGPLEEKKPSEFTSSTQALRFALSPYFVPASQRDIARYRDRDYPEWLSDCLGIFSQLHAALQQQAARPTLRFPAANVGTRPGTDALVDIAAKGNFKVSPPWAEIANRPLAAKRPRSRLSSPPQPPQGRRETFQSMFVGRGGMTPWSGPSIRPDLLLDSMEYRRDPNRFYYKPERPESPVSSFSLECQQWRHGTDDEYFDIELWFGSADKTVTGIVECVIHAENLSAPIKKVVRINVKTTRGDTRGYAATLIDNLSRIA